MTLPAFRSVPASESGLLADVARHTPSSPFNTPAYAAAAARLRRTPYALVTLDGAGQIVDGCLGLLGPAAGARKLELPSLPALREPRVFWDGIVAFCAREQVTDLVVDTFASEKAMLPGLPRRTSHRERSEYVIDLDPEFESRVAKNHRYSARRAARDGVRLFRTSNPAACENHIRLMQHSTDRRAARGEDIQASGHTALYAALLDAGAGELFQASLDEQVLSSILVVMGESSAYYHSGGTAPDGMKCGASPFLLLEASRELAADGIRLFNLGGADAASESLRTFKIRFGTREVQLASATYLMVPSYRRIARKLLRRLRKAAPTSGSLAR